MLSKENRLTRLKDFELLYKEGHFVNANLMTLKIWKIEEDKFPRRKFTKDDLKFGFVVSTKVSKKAVERNRIKRQMREVIRLLLLENKIKTGYLAVFIAKKEILGKEYLEIKQNISYLLKKAVVLEI